MSNNAVFCITNKIKTIRLTVYRCKPDVFLLQLEKILKTLDNPDIDELVIMLLDNGFDLDFETSAAYTADDMCTHTLVNWAWLLDLDNKTLSYWDVTAALNGILETIEQNSISPLDYANWLGRDVVEDFEFRINERKKNLENIGISIINF